MLLANELDRMGDQYPVTQRALIEYAQLRAMVRACRP
jgi:hypothetical protein